MKENYQAEITIQIKADISDSTKKPRLCDVRCGPQCWIGTEVWWVYKVNPVCSLRKMIISEKFVQSDISPIHIPKINSTLPSVSKGTP